jgi:hypothetical protein
MTEKLNSIDKRAFWEAVRLCLVSFHRFDTGTAEKTIETYKSRLADSKHPGAAEIVYHEDPFNLACELAGKQLDVDSYAQAYDKILEEVAP